jgi:drug/metabolite transporter (DMT)-like permease
MKFKKKLHVPESKTGQSLFGCLCVFASAFLFYISTAVIRWAEAAVTIDASFFVFCRFLIGFFIICAMLIFGRRSLAPRRYDLLIGRTALNCIAVFCFYKSVSLTSLAEGNILNMTYPIFLALLSWFVLKEQRDTAALVMVGIAFLGIWFIISPEKMSPNMNNLWGIASGICAAGAILYLNMSRKYHDTETILFYLFGLGSILIFIFFHNHIYMPNEEEAGYLILCALFGVIGQYVLTLGFRYVTAVEGGIISSSRILLAAVLGPWIASDASLTIKGWIGALLILVVNIYLAIRKSSEH